MEHPRDLLDLFQLGQTTKLACGRRLRIVRKLTDETLLVRAKRMGTTRNNLQSMETGASWPNPVFQGWIIDNTLADANFIVVGRYDRLSYEAVELLAEAARGVPYNK